VSILILSINHRQQLVPREEILVSDEVREGMEKLRGIVRGLIDRGNVDLICEESDPCYVSIALDEAFRHVPRIPWVNINMTAQQRLEAGIWQDLLNRPQDIDAKRGVTIDHRIPADDTREHFFKDEIVRAATAFNAKTILALCGDAHTEALKAKLEVVGQQVATSHELIAEKNWK
jgi:hypothetical protein